ncbi:hypothetical protein GGE68_001411 [Rhizobium leguminosarum]|uniref:hypothetical protein n=1 Tax=Rhizobium leguminosarum TaxID=384 RepID=UPI0016077BC6|nr:hypothetical protein [Rhizobium leguminosarum]MBB5663235.1 hypothetical protein [Rhizobium leguminosarum]
MNDVDYMAKQSAALAGQMAGYSQKMPGPVEMSAIGEVHAAFRQADELCRYVEVIVSKLIGGGAMEGSTDDQKMPYGVFPILLSEATSIQRKMNEAMGSLKRLEAQIP